MPLPVSSALAMQPHPKLPTCDSLVKMALGHPVHRDRGWLPPISAKCHTLVITLICHCTLQYSQLVKTGNGCIHYYLFISSLNYINVIKIHSSMYTQSKMHKQCVCV